MRIALPLGKPFRQAGDLLFDIVQKLLTQLLKVDACEILFHHERERDCHDPDDEASYNALTPGWSATLT